MKLGVSKMKTFLIVTVVAVAGFGLGQLAPAYAKKGAHKSAKHSAPASTDDCKKDSDCTVVPDDCCPCSSGGAQRAIPKKDKESYEKDRKKRCTGTMCAEVVSPHPSCAQRAFCGAGICELGDAPAESKP